MTLVLTFASIEAALNRCKIAQPFDNCILPKDMRLMGDVYGRMIYEKCAEFDVSALPEETQQVLQRWVVD